MPKRGRLTQVEMTAIEKGVAEGKTPEAIGTQLDRNPEVILKYIKDNIRPKGTSLPAQEPEVDEANKIVIRQELRNTEAWKSLKEEFSPEEIKFFEQSYIKIMSQMNNNIFPTEEIQIHHSVKYELLMRRNLIERKKCREEIDRTEKIYEEFMGRFGGNINNMSQQDRDFGMALDTQLNVLRSAEQARTNEYVKLQERHSELMKSLKSTRDQRIKQLDTLNEGGFISVIKMLAQKDEAERQGRQLELVKLASNKEYDRLGHVITYDDGNADNPILSADTVDFGRADEEPNEQEEEDKEKAFVE